MMVTTVCQQANECNRRIPRAPAPVGDVGVMWTLGEKTALGVEAGVRYHSDIGDDDSALAGLGLQRINDSGSRLSYPLNVRLQVRF